MFLLTTFIGVPEIKSIIIEFPCQCPQKGKQIDYNQLKIDYNFTKIFFPSIIIDFFPLLWTLTVKLKYNRFFFHGTVRVSTHIEFFLRCNLKLFTLVTCSSI